MGIQKQVLFITGQNGMLGQHLTQFLSQQYEVVGLQRNTQSIDKPSWNYRQLLEQLKMKAPDAIIHLAGAGIADKRWSGRYKKTIYVSRINGTQWLVNEILQHDERPKTFMCASAIGYYGHRPEEQLTENAGKGKNFVAKIAEHWEAAAQELNRTEVRVINMRFGMILSKTGGALKDMMLPFKLGLGGRLGKGQQKYSWISIDDASRAIDFLLHHETLQGPINLTSPNPVTNQEFTQILAKTLRRPAFMHMPAFVVRLVFGEMADELLLADAHVMPQILMNAGFEFKHAKLDAAMKYLMQ